MLYKIVSNFNGMLLTLLGAFLALFGGFVQKRFDMLLDREENDKNILSEISILMTIFFKAKLRQQASHGTESENVLEISSQITKLVFQMRSGKYKFLKEQIIKFILESLNDFKLERMEELQKKIEEILTNN